MPRALKVIPELTERMVQMVLLVPLALKVRPVLPELMEPTVQMVPPVLPGLRARKVLLVRQD